MSASRRSTYHPFFLMPAALLIDRTGRVVCGGSLTESRTVRSVARPHRRPGLKDGDYFTTASTTEVVPENLSALAAAGVTSITRPRTNGPLSLISTTTDRPFRRLVTRTLVPNGSERCAAVNP